MTHLVAQSPWLLIGTGLFAAFMGWSRLAKASFGAVALIFVGVGAYGVALAIWLPIWIAKHWRELNFAARIVYCGAAIFTTAAIAGVVGVWISTRS